jgi:hypothetical protein
LSGYDNPEDHDMRFLAFSILASLALLATPAIAQTSGSMGSSSQPGDASSRVPPDTAVTVDTQQKLKQSLEQNGFKNVVVVPEAYVIHAQARDGSRIVMEVSPDQMRAIVERSGSSTQPSGTTSR